MLLLCGRGRLGLAKVNTMAILQTANDIGACAALNTDIWSGCQIAAPESMTQTFPQVPGCGFVQSAILDNQCWQGQDTGAFL